MYASHYGNPITDILGYYFGLKGVIPDSEVTVRTTSTLFNYFIDLPYILGGQSSFGLIIFFLFLLGVSIFFIDLILGFDKIFKNEEIRKKLFVFLWIIVPFLVLGYITSYVEQRYISADLIFLFFLAFLPLLKVEEYLLKKEKIGKKKIFIFMFLIVLLLMIPNFTLGRDLTDSKSTSYSEIKEAGLWIKENSNQSDTIVTQSKPQTVYYSERTVLSCDDATCKDSSSFENLVKENHPKYFLFSSYEQYPEWVYSYPQNHTSLLTPIKAFYQGQNPVVVIYEFNYS
jgi:hypothetical protein